MHIVTTYTQWYILTKYLKYKHDLMITQQQEKLL